MDTKKIPLNGVPFGILSLFAPRKISVPECPSTVENVSSHLLLPSNARSLSRNFYSFVSIRGYLSESSLLGRSYRARVASPA